MSLMDDHTVESATPDRHFCIEPFSVAFNRRLLVALARLSRNYVSKPDTDTTICSSLSSSSMIASNRFSLHIQSHRKLAEKQNRSHIV